MAEKRKLAFYIRLSDADEEVKAGTKDESNSITGQRKLLYAYIKKTEEFAGFEVLEYFDDGYSGTMFNNRAEFQRLIQDAELGRFECIIVKDFSRFGRDYLEVGNYLEADTIGIPVVPQGTEGIIIDILGEPGNTVGGHTVELDSVSVCTGQLPVLHMESAVLSVRSGVIDRGRLENCWFGFSGLCPGCFGGRCLFRGSGTFGDGFCDGSRRFRGSRCCGFIRRILPATASESTGA